MQHEIIQMTDNFEAHAQETENGVEYWLARDLQHLLGYSKWDNFLNVISKARTACELSGHDIADHFADVGKMVELGSGSQREIPDIILKARDFATEITIHNAREQNMRSEPEISQEHVTNNQAVRQTLLGRGIRPETLPPEEDVKKVECRLASEQKRALKNPDGLDAE